MQKGNFHYRPPALQGQTASTTAPAYGLGGSPVGTFSIPFHPFDIVPLGPMPAGETGLVAHSDRHRVAKGNQPCLTEGGSHPT